MQPQQDCTGKAYLIGALCTGSVISSNEGNFARYCDSPKILTSSDIMTVEKPLKHKRCHILDAEMHSKKRKANPNLNFSEQASTSKEGVDEIQHSKKRKGNPDANFSKQASTSKEGLDESNSTGLRPVTLVSKIGTVVEKLQNENKFDEALCDLIELLKLNGFKQKKLNLYFIMRSIYFYALHLVGRKQVFELDITKLKSDLVKHTKKILKLLIDVLDVFKLSLEENCWCCFTDTQKHYIELYEKHCREWKMIFMEELVSYQSVFDDQQNESKDTIDLHNENALEDFEEHENNFIVVVQKKTINNEEISFENENVLITWLEKEECTTKIAKSFFYMMHSIHNHVIKLLSNKNEYEGISRGTVIKNLKKISLNLTKLEKILDSLEQSRNQFSFAEWKNIELVKKHAKELRLNIENKVNATFQDKVDENEKNMQSFKRLKNQVHQLEQSNRNLQYQFKEVQNEIIAMQSDHKKELQRLDEQIAIIQKDIQNYKKEISEIKEKHFINEIEMKELREIAQQHEIKREPVDDPQQHEIKREPVDDPPDEISPNVARIIALVSIYLNVFHGATIDSICSYLHQIDSSIDCRIAEDELRRFPLLFREDVTGTGADLKKKWYFTGYQT